MAVTLQMSVSPVTWDLPSFTGNRNNIDIFLYNLRALLYELRLFIVSEFGFEVGNRTTALATMEYLPILLGKYPGIYFLELTRVFTVFT